MGRKLLVWTFGLALMAIPLIASIVSIPSRWPEVLSLSSYVDHIGELLFIGIAVGAVATAESLEILVDEVKGRQARGIAVFLLLILILFQIILAGVWYGKSVEAIADFRPLSSDDVLVVLVLDAIILFETVLLKFILWARGA